MRPPCHRLRTLILRTAGREWSLWRARVERLGYWWAMRVPLAIRYATLILLTLASSARADVEWLTILHLNDLHAQLIPDQQQRGGFAHVATAIEEEKREAAATVVLHAGDMVQGSPVSTIFHGTPVYEVANGLGFDAHCLGNHEFDYGWQRIRDFQAISEAPILAANVRNAKGETLVAPAQLIQAGNLRVAVVGALTERLPQLIKPQQAGPWTAGPVVESLAPVVREVHEQADVVIVLGHLFDDEDELVLRHLTDVDVVVSGHDHGGYRREVVIEGRIGVKLRPSGRELGRLDIWFDTEKESIVRHEWKRIPVRADHYPAQRETAALIEKWESRVSERVDVDIASCRRNLGRSDLRALVELAIREVTGADLAYMNWGGIRASLSQGTVRARHIWNMLPFDNELVGATVRGRDLPAEFTKGRNIEPDRIYRFVTNDYVSGQWAEYPIRFEPVGATLRDTFLDWVQSRGQIP